MTTPCAAFVWNQYGAAMDMFDDALRLCPDHLWTGVVWNDNDDVRFGQFWFVAYHTVFWCDLFATGTSEGFAPPPPFVRGELPSQPYAQEQIRAYLGACREKCRAILLALTGEQAQQKCVFPWMEPAFLELQIYALRHVQEHAGQLSLFLGQHGVTGFDWVATARQHMA